MRPPTSPPFPPDPGSPSLADLASRPGKTRRTIRDLTYDGIFTTDSELGEFLAFVAEQRRGHLA